MNAVVFINASEEVNHNINPQPEAPAPQPQVRICSHIKDDGLRCGTPAVNGRHFCYYHVRVHHPGPRLGQRRYRAPLPETIESLQLQIHHITEALGAGRINDRVAGKLLYAVQLSSNLLKMKAAAAASSAALADSQASPTSVTEIPPAMEEVLATPERDDESSASNDAIDCEADMPQTIDEAKRALLEPAEYVRQFNAIHVCDRLSSRWGKLDKRLRQHDRAFQILRANNIIGSEYWDQVASIPEVNR